MSIEYIKKRGQHHAFMKSHYKKEDRDEEWNLFDLDTYYHRCIHNASNDVEVGKGEEIAKMCREHALARYKGKFRKELIKIMQQRYGDNYKKI